jgi:arsenate reductase
MTCSFLGGGAFCLQLVTGRRIFAIPSRIARLNLFYSMKVFLYEKCGTCRKALKWLDERGILYQAVPIRETPPSKTALKKMLKAKEGQREKLFNTSSKDYREPEVKDRLPNLTDDEAVALLASRGNLIKRPFVLEGKVALVGFKEEEWEEAFWK